jgi:hypothetical protein
MGHKNERASATVYINDSKEVHFFTRIVGKISTHKSLEARRLLVGKPLRHPRGIQNHGKTGLVTLEHCQTRKGFIKSVPGSEEKLVPMIVLSKAVGSYIVLSVSLKIYI